MFAPILLLSRRPTRYDSVGSDDCRFIGIKECRRPFPSKRGEVVRLFARKYPLRYAPLRVLRRTEHCAPLTRHGLAFSQPSKGLATPPTLGGQSRDLDDCYIITKKIGGETEKGIPNVCLCACPAIAYGSVGYVKKIYYLCIPLYDNWKTNCKTENKISP